LLFLQYRYLLFMVGHGVYSQCSAKATQSVINVTGCTVPSTSAPVEHVLSSAGIVMQPRRARLSNTMLS